MGRRRRRFTSIAASLSVVLSVLLGVSAMAAEQEQEELFPEQLKRVDQALKSNPNEVAEVIVESCLERRGYALGLFNDGQEPRALRSLTYCFDALGIPWEAPRPVRPDTSISMEEIQERAAGELEQALALTPNIENGLKIYRECAACHMPEGWGLSGGSVPQVAGQHRKVVIKQLADTRAGNRDDVIDGPLRIRRGHRRRPGRGGRGRLHRHAGDQQSRTGRAPATISSSASVSTGRICARCHGEAGEGDDEKYMPRIQAQHYNYLVRQFEWIRDGKRRNADPAMVAQIEGFERAGDAGACSTTSRDCSRPRNSRPRRAGITRTSRRTSA